ncbi:MAG: lysogenization regulator HflD [endosymbiont of Galathealinum brachiosum]|uniref:High frequency lysogenization protein HflD homolog n=1 Tax=endosymbiont of Galathealinum brachiosum TaxID=2200906 RepID=A0A370DIJ2_9GAMM|nr:MAG: lysogenization regulator HflD [endosymbiont of Galathealinum brachiosum]
MEYNQQDRTLALAGIYQSVILVKEVANTGNVADAQLTSILETLFRFDANNVMDVYGDTSTIKKGLTALHDQLSGNQNKDDIDITRYVIQLLHLEKTLKKSPSMMDKLASELENTRSKMDYFHVSHENIIASLADIYQQHISPIGPKIMVQGEHTYLSQSRNANKIRALLFAGIRSAVLWRQCGGSRWQLLLSRKKYIDSAKALLK